MQYNTTTPSDLTDFSGHHDVSGFDFFAATWWNCGCEKPTMWFYCWAPQSGCICRILESMWVPIVLVTPKKIKSVSRILKFRFTLSIFWALLHSDQMSINGILTYSERLPSVGSLGVFGWVGRVRGGAITFNNTCIPRWCYAMARPCHLSLFMLGYFMLGSSSLGWRHPKRQPREINVAQTTFCHFEAWFQTSHRKSPGCAGLEFFEENEQTLLYPWQRSSCSKVWE